jgi:hypothetical protein
MNDSLNSEWRHAVFTAIKCNWGVGMMAMPFMLDQAGFASGIALFILAMLLAWLGIKRMLHCREIVRLSIKKARTLALEEEGILENAEAGLGQDASSSIGGCSMGVSERKRHGKQQQSNSFDRYNTPEDNRTSTLEHGTPAMTNYSDIVRMVIGNTGADISMISIIIAMYGSNIAYMVFIKENMSKFTGSGTGISWEVEGMDFSDITGPGWIGLTCIPLAALVCLSDLKFLGPISIAGLACAVGFEVSHVRQANMCMQPCAFTVETTPMHMCRCCYSTTQRTAAQPPAPGRTARTATPPPPTPGRDPRSWLLRLLLLH